MALTKFDKFTNRGTKVCRSCGKRTWEGRGGENTCEPCDDLAMMANGHSDNGHPGEFNFENPWECPVCGQWKPKEPINAAIKRRKAFKAMG